MKIRTPLPLGAIWHDSIAFLRKEIALVLPLALIGFGLPLVTVMLALPIDQIEKGIVAPGPWMLWFLPSGLLSMFGTLSISALALTPGISVRESVMIALRRMPAGLGLFLLDVAMQLALQLLLEAGSLIDTAVGGKPGVVFVLISFANFAFIIWLFVRVMPVWALLVGRTTSPIEAIRLSFRLTGGCYPRLLLVRLGMAFGFLAGMLVAAVPIGAIGAVVGRLSGDDQVATTLSYVAIGAVIAVLMGCWTVYVARLTRWLEGSNSGM